jgi:type 1 fimbria pilin
MRILWTAAALACLSAPAAAAQPYDGTWNVAIQTKAGSCDPTANYAVTVTEGKVSGRRAAPGDGGGRSPVTTGNSRRVSPVPA